MQGSPAAVRRNPSENDAMPGQAPGIAFSRLLKLSVCWSVRSFTSCRALPGGERGVDGVDVRTLLARHHRGGRQRQRVWIDV